jgi:hypothetical protein
VILLFAGCSALVSGINGGGPSHAEKSKALTAALDRVPEDDWTELYRFERKVEPGCLSIDTPCHYVQASWSVDQAVNINDVGSRLGVDMNESEPGRGSGCLVHDPAGSGLRAEICVRENDKSAGEYLVSVTMTRP